MSGTYDAKALRKVTISDGVTLAAQCRKLEDGSYVYDGERPGEGRVGHGYFSRSLLVLFSSGLRRIVLRKRRWYEVATGRTCHSRPPGECGGVSCSAVVVVVALWCWLDAAVGLGHRGGVVPESWERVSLRTVQRWKRRAERRAMLLQQAVRRVAIEKSEPRSIEQLVPGGLPPPTQRKGCTWADRLATENLWRALALLLGAAIRLRTSATLLLTEAREGDGPFERLPI